MRMLPASGAGPAWQSSMEMQQKTVICLFIMCVCAKLEVSIKSLPQLLSTLYYETVPELANLSSLTGHRTPGIFVSPLSSVGIKGTYHCSWLLSVDSGDMNSLA